MKIIGGAYLDEHALKERGLRAVGVRVMIHETATLVDLDRIEIGSDVRIDAYSVLSAAGGHLKIGNHVHIGCHACIFAAQGVEMCDFSGLSQGGKIYSQNDDYSGGSLTGPTIPREFLRTSGGKVTVGRHCIIGSGSIVLPNLNVGEGATVGALSLVRGNLDPWGVYAGVPTRRLRDRRRDLLMDEERLLTESPEEIR